ncbi:hypothetical protein BVI434_400031 [Burkholderia vietnamiensis]|nr:hypothetical protein BVI434_400031 [Burkholderia vietnamiensis]
MTRSGRYLGSLNWIATSIGGPLAEMNQTIWHCLFGLLRPYTHDPT